MAEPFVGEIRIFAGNYAPVDWYLCEGQLLDIASNQVLYALLGTVYGGNGVTTFGLPDLRGKLPIGQGTGTGLTPRILGQTPGSAQVTLNQGQLPEHNHVINAVTTTATTATPGPLLALATIDPPVAPATQSNFYFPGTPVSPTTTKAFSP